MRRKSLAIAMGLAAVTVGLVAPRSDVVSFFAACGGGDPAGTGRLGLWVMDADGGSPHPVIEGWVGRTLAWSPDSSRIVSFREPHTGSTSLTISTVDGAERRPLTIPMSLTAEPAGGGGEAVSHVTWTRDGARILFVSTPSTGGPPQLHAVRPDGTGRALLATGDELFDLAWSPDGTAIAYSTGFALGVMDVDGSAPRIIVQGPGRIMQPAWSPDGHRIVFSAEPESSGDTVTRLEVVHTDGSGRREVAAERGRYLGSAAWSPDGRWIGFDSYPHDDRGRLMLVRPDGSDRHDVTAELGKPVVHEPAWSPDGRWLAYVENGGIAVAASDGGQRRCLVSQGRNHQPSWSPDGTMIAFFRS